MVTEGVHEAKGKEEAGDGEEEDFLDEFGNIKEDKVKENDDCEEGAAEKNAEKLNSETTGGGEANRGLGEIILSKSWWTGLKCTELTTATSVFMCN